MKKRFLIGILALLSILCGYLFSKASLIGKAGMTFVYKEYAFLKTWWQGALFVFAVWLVFLLLQGWAQRRAKGNAHMVHIACIIAAITGFYFTYHDFRHTLSHRLLGERFHLGGYLFWTGWILISIYFLANKEQGTNEQASMAKPNSPA